MDTTINKEIFENEDFFNDYLPLLINRVTHSSMELERDLGNVDNPKNAVKLKNNMKAFCYLINLLKEKDVLSESVIIKVANLINKDAMYISNGYRLGGLNTIADTNIPISKPEDISNDMKKLIYNYYNEWSTLDSYEREAKFQIDFIRIHPFEDGNGRTSRLLLNFNLLQMGLAPVIITTDLEEYYHLYIKNGDYSSMANLFKIQSVKEKMVVDKLYNEYQEELEGKVTL